jgi:hypothetical protein
MSVTLPPWELSNPGFKPWVITVVVIVLITWRTAGEAVGLYADALAMATAVFARCVQQRSTATTTIVPAE